ncbi:MAG: phosphoribosylformylglycinamidine synthase, partial [Candidatus Aenigmatarchaeota archaeon]
MITSYFRKSGLWENECARWLSRLRESVSADIESVDIERRFLVDSERPLNNAELETLGWLLRETFEPGMFSDKQFLDGDVIEVGPRLAIVTPASTNAVSICHACGLSVVRRIEQTKRFRITMKDGAPLTDEQKAMACSILHDRMTEQPYPEPPTTFDAGAKPEPVKTVPLLKEGVAALKRFNHEMGTAFDGPMMKYIMEYYMGLGRNPTDVELFMFGQLNSEHCRHHRFKGVFIIDGQRTPDSLFGMISSTMDANPGNVLVAYSDNAAVLAGRGIRAFIPSDPTRPSPAGPVPVRYCITFKVETHNHPTTVSAFPGAATGSGGEIRDRQGVGRGGIPVAGLACYYVANLLIPGYDLPWEREYAVHPHRFQTPLDIIIEASDGASDYGNKFGQPLILGSFTSFEQMVGDDHYGWRKTCMVAGGCGLMDERHAKKLVPENGHLIVQVGGDAYSIGLGGGSGSSKDAGGQEAGLDFDSVQRDNAEMENRFNEVIRACSELGDDNPIVSITDLGAGGESVALPEIVDPVGAKYEIRNIPCGDPTMPVYVLWCNESQERMVMIVSRSRIGLLREICRRNRCPMSVVGEVTGDGRLVLTDRSQPVCAPREQRKPVDVDMDFLLADLPEMVVECERAGRESSPLKLPKGLTVSEALERVLRVPKVASKGFLTRKVDRSVGGRVARQQTVGPLQLTLADCAVTADDFFATTGMAMAIGEQPVKGLVDTMAGGRMSVGESLTNIMMARVDGFESVNFSATWQWPCKQPGEDAALYDTVRAVTGLCKELGLRIPVGKDSVSMTAWTELDGQKHPVKSPGTVQMISFAPCPDITKVLTPDIKSPGSRLLLLDLSGGKRRLGGSALAQSFNQVGGDVPDVDPSLLRRGFEAVQKMISRGLVLAGHDRSDGGLITCLLEMAFAGNCGFDVKLDSGVWGDDPLACLFSEELGVVLEYANDDDIGILDILENHGLMEHVHVIGKTTKEKVAVVTYGSKTVLNESVPELRDIWQETSYELDKLQANPGCVEDERIAICTGTGMYLRLGFQPRPTPDEWASDRPKVAVLREEGTNGHREMMAAFHAAGFESWDVTMTDIVEGKISLCEFRGIAFSGGFSFADVLDAGKGWAGVI